MYESIIPLNRVPEGAIARVTGLFTTGAMRRRLQDIGLNEGTDTQCLQTSPAGAPIASYLRGAAIAIRAVDSGNILDSCHPDV